MCPLIQFTSHLNNPIFFFIKIHLSFPENYMQCRESEKKTPGSIPPYPDLFHPEVYSGLRLVLYSSFVDIWSVVFVLSCWQTNRPSNAHRWKHNLPDRGEKKKNCMKIKYFLPRSYLPCEAAGLVRSRDHVMSPMHRARLQAIKVWEPINSLWVWVFGRGSGVTTRGTTMAFSSEISVVLLKHQLLCIRAGQYI